jgi:hypothetical protein
MITFKIERVWIHKSSLPAMSKDSRFIRVVLEDGNFLLASFMCDLPK